MSNALRCGRWEDTLGDVECDALITDPPYGSRTHDGQADAIRGIDGALRASTIPYASWGLEDVDAFVRSWAPRTRGWFCALTSHDLAPAWEAALEATGRYVFTPLAVVEPGRNVRLCGDGPAQWACWLVVARPRTAPWSRWGALPGAYICRPGAGKGTRLIGGKPLSLMRALVRDYSRPGDLVCDPCAGAGTTLRAALAEGRRAIGAEVDPVRWRSATGQGVVSSVATQPDMFAPRCPS